MPIAQFVPLKKLVLSLSQSEKRHFVLYTNRLDSNKEKNKEVLFIKLFSVIDKQSSISEESIYSKLKFKSKTQFTNTKRHLYGQIMKSLRLLLKDDKPLIIRQNIDYAVILYKRGLYTESLSLLDKASTLAHNSQTSILLLEILELKKTIESRHITRSRKQKNRIEKLVSDSEVLRHQLNVEIQMSTVSLNVQGFYILLGFARDERDRLMYSLNFKSQMPTDVNISQSSLATVLWHQSHVWYYYMSLDFEKSYTHAVQWIETMSATPHLVDSDPNLYMRGFHYVLTNSFYLNKKDTFQDWLIQFKAFRTLAYSSYDKNSLLLDFCYFHNAELNYLLMFNKLSKLDTYETYTIHTMNDFGDSIDWHRKLVFYYKLAMLYSYNGQYENALDYLNKVLDRQEIHLRNDIYSYGRLVHLMCHYRIGNFALVINLLTNVRSTFDTANKLNPVVEIMISFMRRGSKAMNFGIKDLLSITVMQLEKQQDDPFNKVAFLYYDFKHWVMSIGPNTTIEKIRRKLE